MKAEHLMPEIEGQDVEYQIWWNETDKYPYVHKTLNGVQDTITDVQRQLRALGLNLDESKIVVKSRVTLVEASDWVDVIPS